MPRILFNSLLVTLFAVGPFSACGGGCGGSSASSFEALEKLPAAADGVIILAVDQLLDESELAAAASSLKEATPNVDTSMLEGLRHLAVVWRSAPSAKAASGLEALAAAFQRPKFAGVLSGTFDSKAVLELVKAQRPDGGAAEGFDFLDNDVAFAILDDHAVAAGDKALVSEVVKSWKGEADGLKKNEALYGALQKVDLSATAVLAATKLSGVRLSVPLDAAAVSYDLRDGLKLKAWIKADSMSFTVMEQAIKMTKSAMTVAPKDKMAGMLSGAGISQDQLDAGLEAIGDLLGSLKFEHGGGEGTIEAETNVDLKTTFKAIYADMLKAQLKNL